MSYSWKFLREKCHWKNISWSTSHVSQDETGNIWEKNKWKHSPFRCWVLYCWSTWRSNVANPPEKAVNEHKHLPKSLREVTWLKSCHTNKPETLRDSSYAGRTLGIQIAQIQPAVAFLHLSFLAMFVRCFESLGRSWDATFERRFLDPFSHLLISKTLPASRGASVACNTTLTTHLSHLTWHPFD